jgi:hypothetical protein
MQIETIGNYQIQLIACEVSASGRWDPFVRIFKFDDDVQDFKCVLDKHHAASEALASYDDAIDAARRTGTKFVESGEI